MQVHKKPFKQHLGLQAHPVSPSLFLVTPLPNSQRLKYSTKYCDQLNLLFFFLESVQNSEFVYFWGSSCHARVS